MRCSSALEAGADRLLLDNMDAAALRDAVAAAREVALRDPPRWRPPGGVTLETVREIAETGVDYVSVGALTHSAPNLDVSLEFEA